MIIRTITTICASMPGTNQGPQEGIDHLFLLPERVLGMDSGQLRKDLAALDFEMRLLQSAPSGNVWLSGGGDNHLVNGQLLVAQSPTNSQTNASKSSLNKNQSLQQIVREERLKLVREKQNEERQQKLEELKQQALAAQKFREKTEEERRRRIEELRLRETGRRHQVEERKRLIMETERERREAIVKRNMEREARIEAKKKMERSSIVFAFGSSTPRMLEPSTDSGSTYWASRRATSTTNVMSMSVACPGPLTRRSSERELANGKKRATSAGGTLERKNADDLRPLDSIYEVLYWDDNYRPFNNDDTLVVTEHCYTTTIMPVIRGGETAEQTRSAARRKTDLMPVVLTARDADGARPIRRSGTQPKRAASTTRLDQLSRPRTIRGAKSVANLAAPAASTRMRTAQSMAQLSTPRGTRAERLRKRAACTATSATSPTGSRSGETTPRPPSALSQHGSGGASAGSSAPVTRTRTPTTPSRKPRPFSIAGTGVSGTTSTPDKHGPTKTNSNETRHSTSARKQTPKTDSGRNNEKSKSAKSSASVTPLYSPTVALSTEDSFTGSERSECRSILDDENVESASTTVPSEPANEEVNELAECDMTGSMTSSQIRRIPTEEEAKAALAERRRLAREQAEREAELEQQRLEAERLAEEERLRKEEEEQRRMEEEQLRLLEESKKAEEERLLQAIEDARKREEEENMRKEEELRLKLEKQEEERKAKEEAERQRIELEIRLKKEEEDRLARKKRVEAIMLRTRAKGGTPSSTPSKDNGSEEEMNENGMTSSMEKSDATNNNVSTTEVDDFLASERADRQSTPNGVSRVLVSGESHHKLTNNNLLDLTDFDVINTNMISGAAVSPQILDLDLQLRKDSFVTPTQQDYTDLLS